MGIRTAHGNEVKLSPKLTPDRDDCIKLEWTWYPAGYPVSVEFSLSAGDAEGLAEWLHTAIKLKQESDAETPD